MWRVTLEVCLAGKVGIPVWRTGSARVVNFVLRDYRWGFMQALTSSRMPEPIRHWASAKLAETDRLAALACSQAQADRSAMGTVGTENTNYE